MIGHGPDHVEAVDYDNEEDEYEIKRSTLESGVIEVLPDEDIVEEPKPGTSCKHVRVMKTPLHPTFI